MWPWKRILFNKWILRNIHVTMIWLIWLIWMMLRCLLTCVNVTHDGSSTYVSFIFLLVMNFFVDIFGFILCCDQSVQTSSNLYDEGCAHVSWKETYWSGSTSLCHIWQCLFEYASRWVFNIQIILKQFVLFRSWESINVDYRWIGCWKNGKHQEGHSIFCFGCCCRCQEGRGRRGNPSTREFSFIRSSFFYFK